MRNARAALLLFLPAAIVSCESKHDDETSPTFSSRQGNAVVVMDLTGDGVADRVVAAPEASSPTQRRAGAVFVYETRADGTSVKNRELWGEVAGDRFGARLFPVGDLDGKGKEDLVITAAWADGATRRSGAIYLYSGEAPAVPLKILGRDTDEHFGWAIASGDFDGDGRRDLAVGAPFSMVRGYQAGSVRIFNGKTPGFASCTSLDASAVKGGFGTTLLGMDLNGDNFDDLVVASAGKWVDVYFGGPSFAPNVDAPSLRIHAWPSSFDPSKVSHVASSFGDALADVGDIDGDGIHDLAIANSRRSKFDTYDNKGAVYVFRGARSFPPAIYEDSTDADERPFRIAAIMGERNLDRFGEKVVSVGDLDHGGKPDLLIGAPWSNAGAPTAGALYFFRGEDIGKYKDASEATHFFVGDEPGSCFGRGAAWDDVAKRVVVGEPDRARYTGAMRELAFDRDGRHGMKGPSAAPAGGSHAGH